MTNIRTIRLNDLQRVAEIAAQAFPIAKPASYLQRLFQKYPEDFYVAEKTGKTVGYVLGYIKSEGLGWIKTIAVHPKYQGQGLGNEMMNFIIGKLKTAGVNTIGLHARASNERGVSFYQKMDFQIIEEIPNYYNNGETAYRMEKKL